MTTKNKSSKNRAMRRREDAWARSQRTRMKEQKQKEARDMNKAAHLAAIQKRQGAAHARAVARKEAAKAAKTNTS